VTRSRGRAACHHGAVQRPDLLAGGFTFFTVALWAGALPAALLIDDNGAFRLTWRPVPLIVLSGLVLLAGSALVFGAGRQLSRAGGRLLGVRPGPSLVSDGWYRLVRNPQHVGTTMVALAPALALEPRLVWMVPLVAAVWLVVGLEPLEDRRLLEVFGDDFRRYRAAVRPWLPRLGG
jgi:protein-S-isoprenylcysteine O-methyltransferase Ste14